VSDARPGPTRERRPTRRERIVERIGFFEEDPSVDESIRIGFPDSLASTQRRGPAESAASKVSVRAKCTFGRAGPGWLWWAPLQRGSLVWLTLPEAEF
jgi:hypothetical protein